MKKLLSILLASLVWSVFPAWGQSRSFAELCQVDEEQRAKVFSSEGLFVFSDQASGLRLTPASRSGIPLSEPILSAKPAFLAESLRVLPLDKSAGLIRVYNALSQVRGLEGRLYHSFTRDKYIPLFEQATRIESERKTTAIPDPPPSTTVPVSENVYMRLKDANFGNSYYEGSLVANAVGLRYTLTNFRNLTYLLIPVIKERRFIAQLYFEFIDEGLLVYSVAAADASDFIASMIDIPSAIEKRLVVIIDWVVDGIQQTP
ncbi:MAG: hypothetical protein LBK00_00860 [Treponema sp.]|jgi:hypothetical protein|nr:hypothetical protein [Treponema sp.]